MANILIDVGHPAHVHLFHGAAKRWQAQRHHILFSALDREMIVRLLNTYKLPYRVTYKRTRGLLREVIVRTLRTYAIARRFSADLFVSFGSPTVGLPAYLLQKPYLALTDTEHAVEQHRLFKPFATVIATPSIFKRDMGRKQRRYNGYHELAYLHPDEFMPNPNVLKSLSLSPDEPYFVVRFVAWRATHDRHQRGFSLTQKRQLLTELSQHGRVLLSVEGDVEPEFAPYVTDFPPEAIHHLLAFAALYVGEGATMSSEAALLGTPALYVNTLTLGYCLDLQNNYGLLYWHTDGSAAVAQAHELLNTPHLKSVWAQRRAKMLSEKINPTPYIVDLGNDLLNVH